MKFYTSDNVELDYTDEGSADAQPVMILSGIGGYKEIWKFTVEMLLENGYRVVNIDARNQGQSERTSKGLRISRHAVDLREIQGKLNLTKPILLGNSMGASTMFAYVSLFTDQDITAIIDVDQSPKMIADDTWKYGFKELTWENFPFYLKEPMGKTTYNGINQELFDILAKLKKECPYDADLNYPFLVDHAFQDWRDILLEMKVPLLIVSGKDSPLFNYHFAQVAADLTVNGTEQIINHSGHLVMAEQPEEFNQTLLAFLQKLNK